MGHMGPHGASDEHSYASGRHLLARVAGMLYDRRLTELQGGNMSLRIGDAAVVSPTLASENLGWRLADEDTLVQDLEGGVLVGDASRVSREIRLHLRLYRTFPELGAIFHLHLPEALGAAASGRWAPGVVAATSHPHGAALVVLEPGLPAQTEPHDGRVVELLGQVSRAEGAISISPGHGIFCVARDVPTCVRAADVFRQRLELARLRSRLRSKSQRADS
jgi:ribulose-5-phosphate 4-epimerase/fuculose-1-phosphate aldolase